MPRLIALIVAIPLAACSGARDDQKAAKALIATHCAACHSVPGVATARGRVGPSLAGVGRRQIIAGVLPNNPANMRLFLEHPQSVLPGGAMPELGLSPQQSKLIADYLLTLDQP